MQDQFKIFLNIRCKSLHLWLRSYQMPLHFIFPTFTIVYWPCLDSSFKIPNRWITYPKNHLRIFKTLYFLTTIFKIDKPEVPFVLGSAFMLCRHAWTILNLASFMWYENHRFEVTLNNLKLNNPSMDSWRVLGVLRLLGYPSVDPWWCIPFAASSVKADP